MTCLTDFFEMDCHILKNILSQITGSCKREKDLLIYLDLILSANFKKKFLIRDKDGDFPVNWIT